jgi:hypothetical protein
MTATTMTTATTTQTTASAGTAWGVRRTRAAAVAAAVAATAVLYLLAAAAGVDFVLSDPGSGETSRLTVARAAGFTLQVSLVGWVAMALLERFTRHARTIWAVLAGAVLVLSFVPVGYFQATASTRVTLAALHVVVAAALLPMLRRRAGR